MISGLCFLYSPLTFSFSSSIFLFLFFFLYSRVFPHQMESFHFPFFFLQLSLRWKDQKVLTIVHPPFILKVLHPSCHLGRLASSVNYVEALKRFWQRKIFKPLRRLVCSKLGIDFSHEFVVYFVVNDRNF